MGVSEKIRDQISSWDETEVGPHRFNGVEFRVNGHEIGHLHGGRLADFSEINADFDAELIRIRPKRIVGWGMYSDAYAPNSRAVG